MRLGREAVRSSESLTGTLQTFGALWDSGDQLWISHLAIERLYGPSFSSALLKPNDGGSSGPCLAWAQTGRTSAFPTSAQPSRRSDGAPHAARRDVAGLRTPASRPGGSSALQSAPDTFDPENDC